MRFSTSIELLNVDKKFGKRSHYGISKGVPSKRNGRELSLHSCCIINVIYAHAEESTFYRLSASSL